VYADEPRVYRDKDVGLEKGKDVAGIIVGVLVPRTAEKGGRQGLEKVARNNFSNRLRRRTPRFTQHSRALRTPARTRPALCRTSVHCTCTALARRRHRPTARDARRSLPRRSCTTAASTRYTGMAIDDAPAFGTLVVTDAHACACA
jgi:hypothetical protein